jgi:hypothetical protein
MGRNLRFEPARSSRALLFSYRQVSYPSSSQTTTICARTRTPTRTDTSGVIEAVEPATAMRLFKPSSSRCVVRTCLSVSLTDYMRIQVPHRTV